MELIDTHAHLDQVEDLEGALKRAVEAEVTTVIAVSVDLESCKRTLEISEYFSSNKIKIYPALGVHPWGLQTENLEDSYRVVEENIERAVAIGEVGLDFWLPKAKEAEFRDLQISVLQHFIGLAEEYDKPLLLHTRGAWKEAYEIVSESGLSRVIFHWFSGSTNTLLKIVRDGYYISASPAAEYSKAHRNAISKAPLENVVLETDSPVRYKGEVSEPSFLIKSLNAVAEIKDVDRERVAEVTTENAKEIFDL